MSLMAKCFDCVKQKASRMETCLELALEGERLCKAGDYRAGVSFFDAALQVGTEDLQILSAIYSQLGNAYFHLQDYSKALEFHRHDLTLTRAIGDQLGEAKASGNLGNTLKVLGRFDEAVLCCQRHLDISKALHDKVGQARALYNLGNVYHAKGRSLCWSGADSGDFPEEAMTALQTAVQFYEANLLMVKEVGDRAAQGRTYGNLGNTHYMLGNFRNAVVAHEQIFFREHIAHKWLSPNYNQVPGVHTVHLGYESLALHRLLIAKEFGDKAAERRACCNLGNAYIFLGEFEVAAEHYKRMLQLARQLRERAVEAQACYSLGNACTLLQDYEKAIDYHLKHLVIARDLNDRVGEGRACWSLGNAYTALGNHDQGLHFAQKHLEISKETGDRSGELTARMNVSDLQVVLGLSNNSSNSVLPENQDAEHSGHGTRPGIGRRRSMENMELMKLSPEKTNAKSSLTKSTSRLSFLSRFRARMHRNSTTSVKVLLATSANQDLEDDGQKPSKGVSPDMLGDEGFFDLLRRFQSNRMDDQRCAIQDRKGQSSTPCSPSMTSPSALKKSHSVSVCSPHDHFLDMVASSQSRRLNDQRASTDHLPGLRLTQQSYQSGLSHLMACGDSKEPPEDFFDALIKCQGARLDDQRCTEPTPAPKGPTVPDEDFFSLILRAQAKRMDEQRVTFSCTTGRPSSN